MDPAAFRALLDDEIVLADGGTGTTLLERGVSPEACADLLNLTDRDLVRGVHASFVEAGARLIETNTFGANRFRLAAFGAAGRVEEVNLAGAARAREAGAELVGGSIGPLGVRLAPYGRVSETVAREAFSEQIAALAAGGVDVLVIETFSDLREALLALDAARTTAPTLAAIVSLTFTRDDRTLLGEAPERVAALLAEAGADAIGANCSEGPDQVLRVLAAMGPHARGIPLVAQPNAGGPQHAGGRTLYSAAPEYTARYVSAFIDAGARIVGGCCGTRPTHIAHAARALATPPADAIRIEVLDERRDGTRDAAPPEPARSRLAAALAAGQRVITVEMEPPHGPSPQRMIAAAETLRDAGATTVNIADSPRAQLRMAPWAAAHLIQTEAGIETILHFPTRGRNLLRIQSDLLAASALGIRNLFAVMGDPTGPGAPADLSEVTPSGLIALVVGQLNEGVDGSGAEIGEPTRFTIGAAVDPNAADLDREVQVLHRKVTAGAGFALTQPVYDPAPILALRARYEDRFGPLTLPLFLGVLPLANARHAEFLHHEVPGIAVPEHVRERLARGGADRSAGLALAVEVAEACRESTSGVYLIPAFRRYDAAAELIERLI